MRALLEGKGKRNLPKRNYFSGRGPTLTKSSHNHVTPTIAYAAAIEGVEKKNQCALSNRR
jgi:hypothetical protein